MPAPRLVSLALILAGEGDACDPLAPVVAGLQAQLEREASAGECGRAQASGAQARGALGAEQLADQVAEALFDGSGQPRPLVSQRRVGQLVGEGALEVVGCP